MGTAFRADIIQLGPNIDLRMGAADPSAGGGVAASVGSFYWQTSTSIIWQKVGAANTAWVYLTPRDLFGDGRDGDVVLGAGTTTLTQDTYYNNLTIPNGSTLVPRGVRIFVRGTITIEAGGVLECSGGNGGATATAGQAAPTAAGSLASGAAGGAGGAAGGSSGTNSSAAPRGFAGSGGAGGAGSGGAGGGAGVASARPSDSQGNPFHLAMAMVAQVGGNAVARVTAGAGGGGGGGDGTAGGGGGGGGGVVALFAREVDNGGAIRAHGGDGGSPPAGNRGGGGGGGGGLVVLGAHAISGASPTVTGGAAGVGSGTGVNGNAGADGMVVTLAL